MKKITLLFAFLLGTISWQVNAQAVNEAAGWPNTSWTLNVIEHTGSSAQDVEADPTASDHFAYDDDDTGSGSHDVIAAESPVIDLTPAHTAGENIIIVSGSYVYNNFSNNEYLAIEFWDADAGDWALLYQFPNSDTPGAPTDDFCSGTPVDYQGTLDISSFTATQLSGFKYRFIYNDNVTGDNGYYWGFCFSSPTLSSTPYSSISFDLNLNPDCANSQFSVEVNVTDMGGAPSVTITDDQGSASQQLNAVGSVTFGPYASGTNVNFTVTNDDDNSFNSSDSISYTCPTNNDDCYNADALTVYPVGGSAGNEITLDTSADYTDSGAHPSCDNTGTNLDAWFTFTVPAGQDGVKVIYGGTKADKVEAALWDTCGGSDLSCQNYTNNAYHVFQGLTAGQTYYLQVWTDSGNAGDFTVVLEELSYPNCADNPTPADGTNNVTIESGRKVALSWDPPTSGATVDSYLIELGTVSGTYTISATLTNNYVDFLGVDENTTYYWKITPISQGVKAIGCSEWSFTTGAYPAAPSNDTCASAIALNVDPGACATPTVADNSFATDSGEAAPSCAHYAGGDLWFSVTVPASGSVTVETTSIANSNLSDTGMSIYSGSCGSLTEIQCDDDSSDDGYFSKIELTGQTPGDVLYVRVWEYDNDRFGEFNICAWDPNASAVADNQIEGFKFYPNPVNHTLNISAKNNIDMLSITNIAGQEVMILTPNTTATQVDMSRLPNGMYFVKARVNGEVTAFKVVKK